MNTTTEETGFALPYELYWAINYFSSSKYDTQSALKLWKTPKGRSIINTLFQDNVMSKYLTSDVMYRDDTGALQFAEITSEQLDDMYVLARRRAKELRKKAQWWRIW